MNTIDQLVEQHIRSQDARLKRIDELLARAEAAARGDAAREAEVAELRRRRDEQAARLGEEKRRPLSDWQEQEIESAGPMAVWDALALDIENLIEAMEG
ncbi:MAG: hypothetical protein D6786_02650 [Gammaproteobacteria bacterium]|nr:MAG: hypothetical protein D6786_02650 [Gammaproteobacteria bacterium]